MKNKIFIAIDTKSNEKARFIIKNSKLKILKLVISLVRIS